MRLTTSIIQIESNSVTMSIKVAETFSDKLITNTKQFANFNWWYTLTPINSGQELVKSIKITKSNTNFSINGLNPDTTYTVHVYAKAASGSVKLSSAKILFKTAPALPTEVSNLKVVFKKPIEDSFSISFTSPKSWGNSALPRVYRLILLVNGKVFRYSDTVLKAANSYTSSKTIRYTDLSCDISEIPVGALQVGILPGLKNGQVFLFNSKSLKCSSAFYDSKTKAYIHKIFIKIKNNFKQVLLHFNGKAK